MVCQLVVYLLVFHLFTVHVYLPSFLKPVTQSLGFSSGLVANLTSLEVKCYRLNKVIDREATQSREIMYFVASVCLSVCALTAEQFGLRP